MLKSLLIISYKNLFPLLFKIFLSLLERKKNKMATFRYLFGPHWLELERPKFWLWQRFETVNTAVIKMTFSHFFGQKKTKLEANTYKYYEKAFFTVKVIKMFFFILCFASLGLVKFEDESRSSSSLQPVSLPLQRRLWILFIHKVFLNLIGCCFYVFTTK